MNKTLGNTLILLILALFFSVPLIAQEDDKSYDDDDDLMEEGFNIPDQGFNLKQRIFIGGNIGLLGFSSQQIGVNVSPFVGVRVTDNIHVGTGFNYSYQAVQLGNGTQARATLLGYKFFGKFLFLNLESLLNNTKREPGDPIGGIYALTEFEENFGKIVENGLTARGKVNTSLYLGIGYQANFYRKFAYFMEATYDLLDNNPNTFPVGIRAGLYYGF